MRPILRPGAHVLRRGEQQLQIGLDPRRAVVLPDVEAVRATLALLGTSAALEEYDGQDTLELLEHNDLVLDSSALVPLIPSGERTCARGDVAAVARAAGDRVAELCSARTNASVRVTAFGAGEGRELAAGVTRMLAGAGVGVGTSGSRPRSAGTAMALVGVGEPHRDLLDDWMRAGTPHLVVRLTEGSAVVGPFVVPGSTACLRCIDGHHTDVDGSWPLLVEQYASLTARSRADGVPEPVDSLLASLAAAWAARDLASYAEGRRPSTWSTTIRFDPHLASIETSSWLRHPACGCAWD
jgi:bacteriocin biosynthesis cyclodehydratase domain-containing protein